MTQYVIDAVELADKVILTKKEYQQLLNRQSPAGLNRSYEQLTTAHAELHRKYSDMVSHCNDTTQALQKANDKQCQELARLRRILRHYDIPEEDIKPAYTADLGITEIGLSHQKD